MSDELLYDASWCYAIMGDGSHGISAAIGSEGKSRISILLHKEDIYDDAELRYSRYSGVQQDQAV